MSRLTFQQLREANIQRLPQFKDKHGRLAHPRVFRHQPNCKYASTPIGETIDCGDGCKLAKPGSDWSLGEWICALTGEVGEAANIVKKIRRGDVTLDEVREDLASELADIQIYLDILAYQCNIDLGAATITKFNQVSLRVKADVMLDGAQHPVLTVARRMLDQSGGWEDCPFCQGKPATHSDEDPHPWHASTCLLRSIDGAAK